RRPGRPTARASQDELHAVEGDLDAGTEHAIALFGRPEDRVGVVDVRVDPPAGKAREPRETPALDRYMRHVARQRRREALGHQLVFAKEGAVEEQHLVCVVPGLAEARAGRGVSERWAR